jgi:predicted GTPase
MAVGMRDSLSVKIVHKANISELVNINPEFGRFTLLNITENDMICWNMDGKTAYCIQVMFIGKTGYGKSTTLNKLCGYEYFVTDEIESCTKKLYSSEYKLCQYNEHYLSLCDLPGIGESIDNDKQYIQWYGDMLKKSACVVYVLRADQRDYSHDERLINTLLRNNSVTIKKLIIGLNYADKIEPVSRISPFKPNYEQMRNLNRKVESVSKLFGTNDRTIYYSATDGYNINKLKNKIADVVVSNQ